MELRRWSHNPIIIPHMDGRMGGNINGPSLIRVPDWVVNPLGRYYLYFAHHQGKYIRLAYADDLVGPWRTHEPGVLALGDSYFSEHIASPDVHLDQEQRQIRLYYHGCCLPQPPHQFTRVALSSDGLHFEARKEILGVSYFRVFQWREWYYALGMPGIFYRSRDGLTGFEQGPTLFTPSMRHTAVRVRDDQLEVFYTNAGDCPERILRSVIELNDDWLTWRASEPVTVLSPELAYEGGDLPLEPSERGSIHEPVRQLRDPALFMEEGRTYLVYTVAGESGIAGADLLDD